jgi:hypothetical protein
MFAILYLCFAFTPQVSFPFGFCRIELSEIAKILVNKGTPVFGFGITLDNNQDDRNVDG